MGAIAQPPTRGAFALGSSGGARASASAEATTSCARALVESLERDVGERTRRWVGGAEGGTAATEVRVRSHAYARRRLGGAEGARGVIETPGLDRRARRASDEEDEEEDDEQREESQSAYVSRGSEERFDAVEGEGSEEVDEGGYATPIREEASE